MAWQIGVSQTVPVICYLEGVETAPTAPITTTVNVAGAGFGAATNDATDEADGAVSVVLTDAEVGAWGFVRVEGANGSIGLQSYTAEGDYTVARAENLDELDAGNLPAEVAAVPTAAQNATAVQEFDAAPYEATADTGTRAIELACAARGAVAGRMSVAGDVLTIYEVDGVTPMETYTLTPAGGPYTARTP